MQREFLKPVAGRQVPDPERDYALLPAEGRNVEMSQYWQRRKDDGDVESATPPTDDVGAASATGKKGGAA